MLKYITALLCLSQAESPGPWKMFIVSLALFFSQCLKMCNNKTYPSARGFTLNPEYRYIVSPVYNVDSRWNRKSRPMAMEKARGKAECLVKHDNAAYGTFYDAIIVSRWCGL